MKETMCVKNTGGFEEKPIKCPICARVFRVEEYERDDVEFCPFCGSKILVTNELSDDELLDQIEKAGQL